MRKNANKISRGSILSLILLLGFTVLLGAFLGVDDQKAIRAEKESYMLQEMASGR